MHEIGMKDEWRKNVNEQREKSIKNRQQIVA
jgi:hypothetical protein